jgi:hypothetical protein
VAAASGPTVEGSICMQRIFMGPTVTVAISNGLNCTANDIKLSRAIGVTPDTCIRGTTIDLTATFEVIVTANSRYDAGFFFRIDGGDSARGDGATASGDCSLSWLAIPPPSNPPALDLDHDTCGDINAGTFSTVPFTIPDVTCEALPGTDQLRLPNCTSWHSNQGTPCTGPTSAADSHVYNFHPDTKSKCVCDDTFTVPVTVEEATLTVVKSASPTNVPEPGGLVTYTVQITNTASIESVTVTSIIDDLYGDLSTDTSPRADNTCLAKIGTVLKPGDSTTCSFKAPVAGNAGDIVTDEVEVCTIQLSGNNAEVCGSDHASVSIADVFTAPTLAKTAQSATCQVDVTYQVGVSNNSTIDTLTVNSLNDDKFGDITTVHAAGGAVEQVVSTTCGKDGASGGPGTLPHDIAPRSNYTCSFVGRIVNTSCSFKHTDTVTGDVTDDDGTNSKPYNDATVTLTLGGLAQ